MATLKQVREIRRINLKALIENQYKNQAHFIRETGINHGLISALLRGEKTFGEVAARNIEDRAGIPPGWLDNENQTEMPEKPTFVPAPILDVKASCGNGYANGDNVEISGTWNMPLDYLKALGVSPANAEIIIATSYSMFPTIRNGAHVLINKADRSPREGSIYAINLDSNHGGFHAAFSFAMQPHASCIDSSHSSITYRKLICINFFKKIFFLIHFNVLGY